MDPRLLSGQNEAPERAAAAPEPIYLGLKRSIRARIEKGEWAPGARVPSENELVADFGVSRMTANRALKELAADGLIVRVKGAGSFVADRKGHSALFEVRNIASEIAARGHDHRADVVSLAEVPATPDIADRMELDIGAPVFHSLLVHFENDVPVQIEDRHVVPASAPDYLEQDFSSVTPNAYLSEVAPLSRAEHIVEAVLPQPWESRLLAVARSEPCLLVHRRTFAGPRIVSVARLLYPGSRYRLEGHFSGGSGG
ncbi:HTH-type transcriptional repressor YvoA [Hartmannibacter diazotrophicus]|uniref:Histidine utilization repressor n=1 Tax=Hartmannibacter diazotrophicus TaxID=1482074 RepID=A0A2C9D0I4_9HYPH|nr:histidine utilization repressor [Hartmannibacter diazotrophicus]SON53678.1 HTH-type transcriptional repressor YvoA [Hartmannibacter diazotrophicus]